MQKNYKFIDLFAGIGGFRLAFMDDAECVFTCEWDKFAQETYSKNFNIDKETIYGDITTLDSDSKIEGIVPDHDILLAGFPCQAFSIAGHKKGLEDTRGTLFYSIAKILQVKKPRAFLLENVKGLLSHDKKRTLEVILTELRAIGYYIPTPKILNALDFGLAQNRERVYIVGFLDEKSSNRFVYPTSLGGNRKKLDSILEPGPVPAKYYLSNVYLDTLKRHRAYHKSKGNGFGYIVKDPSDYANTLLIGGMGKERNLIVDNGLVDRTPTTKIKGEINNENIRRLTPKECARLQGFPDKYIFPVSDAQSYKQIANSVPVAVIRALRKEILKVLEDEYEG